MADHSAAESFTPTSSESERYRRVVDAAGLALFEFDFVNGTSTSNEAFKRYKLAHEPLDLIMRNPRALKVVHVDDLDKLKSFFRRLATVGGFDTVTIRMVMEDNTCRWSRINGVAELDDEGHFLRTTGTIEDVEDVQNQYLRALQDYATEADRPMDSGGTVIARITVDLNEDIVIGLELADDRDTDGLVGRPLTEVIPVLDEHRTMDDVDKEIGRLDVGYTTGEQVRWQKTVTGPDGGIMCVREVARFARNPFDGVPTAFISIYDVTDEVVGQYISDRILMSIYDYVAIVNSRTGIIEYAVNPEDIFDAPTRGTDYTATLATGMKMVLAEGEDLSARVRENSVAYVCEQLAGGMGVYSTSFDMNDSRDGTRRRKLMRFRWLSDGSDGRLLFSRADVTDVYQTELEREHKLASALKEARRANKAKTDFLSNMSHDIRTPLNAIIGLTDLALGSIDKPEQVRSDLLRIDSSGKFLLTLVNDILDMSRIERGVIELNPEPYAYDDLLVGINAMFEPMCRERGIDLTIDEDPRGETVLVDRVRINQVFFNLLSNAVKFTPEGGRVTMTVQNSSNHDGFNEADYVFTDTGCGMSEEFIAHAFEPFSQETNGVRLQQQGTGLGLSIAHTIVELMGGTISIESELGQGTTITVHLALPIVTEQASASERIDESCLEGITVLLVEDNDLNALVAQGLLERRGINVDRASDGVLGVEAFSSHERDHYAAILMDMRMPHMDGLEATRTIRALERPDAQTVPIIAMTANAFDTDRKLTIAAGMDAHLAKPIDTEVLFSTLARCVTFGREAR